MNSQCTGQNIRAGDCLYIRSAIYRSVVMGLRGSASAAVCSVSSEGEAATVVFKTIQPPCIFPLISVTNKSCNIECCVNNMFQINHNVIVSQGLELIQSMFRKITILDQHPLI